MQRAIQIARFASNAAIAIAAIAIVVHLGNLAWTDFRQDQAALQIPGTGRSTIENTSELALDRAERTILLGTASTCRFCTASMPFYQRLTKAAKDRGVRVVAFAMEDVETNRDYLKGHGVIVDGVVSATKNKLTLPATPVLIVANREGQVVGLWRGMINDPAVEADVFAVIGE
jgi:hypothetical protein